MLYILSFRFYILNYDQDREFSIKFSLNFAATAIFQFFLLKPRWPLTTLIVYVKFPTPLEIIDFSSQVFSSEKTVLFTNPWFNGNLAKCRSRVYLISSSACRIIGLRTRWLKWATFSVNSGQFHQLFPMTSLWNANFPNQGLHSIFLLFRPERFNMRLYSLDKRNFLLVFMAFFACFALGIFIGLAG